jgi:hypothetical protein
MAKTLDITPNLDTAQDIYVSQIPYLPASVNQEYRLFRVKGIGTINVIVASISGNFAYTLTNVDGDGYLMSVNNPTDGYTYSLLITQTYNGVITSKYVNVLKGRYTYQMIAPTTLTGQFFDQYRPTNLTGEFFSV